MQADVGIAMGTGTDITIESADVVLPGTRLEAVLEARELAAASYGLTVRNVVLALGFNAMGGVGCISVTANVLPRLCAEFQAATLDGDWPGALRLQDRLYPLHAALFADARPVFPLKFQKVVQHRLARAAGERWALMPHAYAFVDPLFSTGIAWGLLAVERLALAFEDAKQSSRVPAPSMLRRYDGLLARRTRPWVRRW